ncbi:alpha-mannosidase [Trichomonascus vanleenenianus]|uniref:alpha-mannosidase n=1 Tax=Trichomonascus vanleenenianus TaxID=2268995 RepID=UPI003ECA14BB
MSYARLNLEPVAKKVESIYTHRLNLFTANGEYQHVNLPSVLDTDRARDGYVKLETYAVPDVHARPPFKEAVKNTFRPASIGEKFGPSWATHWFRVQIKVPDSWPKKQEVLFNWDCGNEGLIFTEDGRVVVGLSGEERQEWIIPPSWNDGKWHTFYIETGCNGMFGNADPHNNIQPPIDDRYFTLEKADLVLPNVQARALKADYLVIVDAAKNFEESSWQKHRAIEVANAIIDNFNRFDAENSIAKCRKIAQEFLGKNVDSADVFKGSQEESLVFGVGHCHIDTAWLWPYAETRRKIGRSWSTQLDLIERYPEYNFVCSQAVQYAWLKEDYPELFERLKKAIKAGRFIPIGGSWVESDTNLPSGEAIARQFLYGQRFFESNFGIRCKTFWLPDTFGYAAQIPQLCREAEMERFLTQKLSWNNINVFPNTTFNWVALDGSQVLCHMPPADTYNSCGDIKELKMCVSNHRNLGIDQSSLLLFGFGDGGGGPTPDMLERLRRARGLADTVGNLPRVAMSTNIDEYFDRISKRTNNGKDLVSWVGELYFEFHRGTYTTQANTKKGNRHGEVILHDLEYLATIASLISPRYQYPKKELDRLWEGLLLNQFHDVLPGSSIEMVYKDAEDIYNDIQATGKKLISEALAALGYGSQGAHVAVNTLPWARTEVVEIPSKDGGVQAASNGTTSYARVSSSSDDVAILVSDSAKGGVSVSESKGAYVMENSKLRVSVDNSNGLVTSIYDKAADREILSEPTGNQYVLFEDQPLNWQGWDTEVYSLNKRYVVNSAKAKVAIAEQGEVRGVVTVSQPLNEDSWIRSSIILDDEAPMVVFDTEVEWHHACQFLKVEFPVDIHSDQATYDSMYGAVKRPTHYNTFWDVAKFEVCCHKYADLSDYSYGVTVLNDSKYGFSVHGNTMRLSLLRSSKAPDGNADMGFHRIRYAVLGHSGTLNAEVVRLAQNFNHPLHLTTSASSDSLDVIKFDGPSNVVISAVKRAEDDADVSVGALPARKGKSIVVRLYDSLGGKSKGNLVLSSKLPKATKVFRCNILEDDKAEVGFSVEGGSTVIPIQLRSFEIASYRIQF